MKNLALTLALVLTALVVSTAISRADTSCTNTLSGTIEGNVVVPSGASCTLSDVTVTGGVQVLQNASLTVDATQQPVTINGNVLATNCAFALLEGGVSVGGNVQIQGCSQQSGFVGPGIKIGGNFQCQNNSGACEGDLGDVHGSVLISNNSSNIPSDVSLTSVGGVLQCQGNSASPTHSFGPDWANGQLSGQCAATLGFAPTTAAPSCPVTTLSNLNVPNITVAAAVIVEPTGTIPQYCKITGAVATNGEGYGPGSAEFILKLPVQWNGHFLFVGCGGNCGSINSTSVNPVDSGEALGLGYAVVNTDTGHEQDPTTPDPTWILLSPGVPNTTAIIDFYYRAVHQVTVAAKQYVEAYYTQPIDYAYFDGCSTGGRQSMMEGKRYPVDYDGLVVGDPAIAVAYARTSGFKQAEAFLPPTAQIPFSTVAQVDAAVKASCDAADGVMDGLIQNPAQCSFDPSTLVAGGTLSATQAAALQEYTTLVTDQNGAPVYPGMPISDLSTSGFEGINDFATVAPDPTGAEPWGGIGNGPVAWTLTADPGIRYYVEYNPTFDVNNDWPQVGNVVQDSALALLRERQFAANSDDPFQLENFLKKGGKVIMYHGGSDPLITPYRSTWYYQQLASLHGGYGSTQQSVRLFMVPGMGHCGGGVSPNSFDTLKALDKWVTKNDAPDGIIATATNGRTMPLCKYPEEASYSGSGDVNLAANWSCKPNDIRMLHVGSNGTAAGATPAIAQDYLYEDIGLGGQ